MSRCSPQRYGSCDDVPLSFSAIRPIGFMHFLFFCLSAGTMTLTTRHGSCPSDFMTRTTLQ